MFEGKDELAHYTGGYKKGIGKARYKVGNAYDLRRCTACHACTVGCMVEQKSPPGIKYRPVYEEEMGTFPRVKRRFTPRLCNQCDNPPCVEACPNKGEGKATWKSTKGLSAGIVMINYDGMYWLWPMCLGCPYKARALDGGTFYTEGTPKIEEYDQISIIWEYSRKWPREKNHLPIGNARKCHFCLHRLKKGYGPHVCQHVPLPGPITFGDPEDKESLIYKVIKENKVKVLKAVTPMVEAKVRPGIFKGMDPEDISKKVGYPGKTPVFADSALTKPRVYYILP